MMGSVGWKVASFTEPWWPGSLYSRRRVFASQMYTIRSALPAVTWWEHQTTRLCQIG